MLRRCAGAKAMELTTTAAGCRAAAAPADSGGDGGGGLSFQMEVRQARRISGAQRRLNWPGHGSASGRLTVPTP